MVTEFFEMFLRNEKPYARLCYDLSLVYRSPATTFHDIDITGWEQKEKKIENYFIFIFVTKILFKI